MADTAEQIAAKLVRIRNARDAGVLIVRHGDESTQFRSLKEMNAIIADLEGQLETAAGTTRPRISYIQQNSKGY